MVSKIEVIPMRKMFLILCLIALVATVGCSKEQPKNSEPISSSDATTSQTESTFNPSSETNTPSATNKDDSSNQEIGSGTTSSSTATTENTQGKPNTKPETTPNTSTSQIPSDTEQPAQSDVAFSKLSFSYQGYISANEPKPYIKEKAIYDILYSGTRAQVGDTLVFKVSTLPSNATDKLVISVSDNLSYKIDGDKVSVTINGRGAYDIGSLSFSSKLNPSISSNYRFSIDENGNPYSDFSSILSEYISLKGMSYCTVEKGYTQDNPSLSITHFPDAPSWDDKITKSNTNWMLESFNLIDEYKKHSFTKVNFIITSTDIGFSASK